MNEESRSRSDPFPVKCESSFARKILRVKKTYVNCVYVPWISANACDVYCVISNQLFHSSRSVRHFFFPHFDKANYEDKSYVKVFTTF